MFDFCFDTDIFRIALGYVKQMFNVQPYQEIVNTFEHCVHGGLHDWQSDWQACVKLRMLSFSFLAYLHFPVRRFSMGAIL